jgi:SH3 domain-containing protein
MRFAFYLFFLCLPLAASADWPWGGVDEPQPRVQVVKPFIEWRTGPAAGYPVFHTSEKGEWLTLLKRKTSWLKVNDQKGREGWVHLSDVQNTVDETGEQVALSEPRFDDFESRRWEVGLLMGQFEEAASTAIYGGFMMTENLSAELWATQILGSASEIRMFNANIVHQPFPEWRVSPFMTLGVGHIFIEPKSTLAVPEDRDNSIGHAGLGVRAYIADNYFIRAEVKDYKIFTNRATNEEALEWKIGLSIFF